jgi:putative sporulation protein YtaF
MSGIRIPKRCALLISVIGSLFLGLSLLGGQVLAVLLPEVFCRYAGAAVLCLTGGIQLAKEGLRALFRSKKPHIRQKALGLVIEICFDETLADADGSKVLSIREAVSFAAALSLDSLVSGLGAGIGAVWIVPCLGMTLVLGFVLTLLGAQIGTACSHRRLEWLGGCLLILLGVIRLI